MSSANDPRVGTLAAGRFLIKDVIGSGGMSSIYRAYQLSMERDVALKILTRENAEDEEMVARFTREARAIAQLRSPHTVTVHDFGELEGGAMFIAMELIQGTTLEAVIEAGGPVPHPRAVMIMDQICASLEEAHSIGLVHRDLKPKNVMIEPGDRAKVLDFGIVKVIRDGSPGITRAGWVFGTPPYMAPELWSEELGAVGPQSDVYAAGVLFFEMLAGRLPFTASSVPGFMHKHIYDTAPTIRSVGIADLDRADEIDAIIARCLAKKPSDRFQSMALLRRALAELERPRSVPAPAPSRSPRSAIVSAAVALAIAAALTVILVASLASTDQPRVAPSRPDAATTEVKDAATSVERVEPTVDPIARSSPRISTQSAIGLERQDAVGAVESLKRPITQCFEHAGDDAPARMTLFVMIGESGRPTSATVRPESDRALKILDCIKPKALALSFPPLIGFDFATLSIGVER